MSTISHHFVKVFAWGPTVLLLILILPTGCSKEEMKQKMEQVQAQVETKAKAYTEAAVQAVEEKLPESGSIMINMTPPVEKIDQLNLRLISIGDGRPNVVQIMNYDLTKTRPIPGILIQGTTMAATASSLAGQTVECDLYFQAAHSAPITITKPGESISVTFGSLNREDHALTARLGSSQLSGSDGQSFLISGGELVAVILDEEN